MYAAEGIFRASEYLSYGKIEFFARSNNGEANENRWKYTQQ